MYIQAAGRFEKIAKAFGAKARDYAERTFVTNPLGMAESGGEAA